MNTTTAQQWQVWDEVGPEIFPTRTGARIGVAASIADAESIVSAHNATVDAAANVTAAEGYFAWAAFAKNGNVIIWSKQRDQVKRVADQYCTAIRPVVVLHSLENAAARDILVERRRQVETEGYDLVHDDEHACGEIAAYAAFYAMPPAARDWPATETGYGETFGEAIVPADWKVPKEGDRRRELVKAGALILAEIERLDRAATSPPQQGKKLNQPEGWWQGGA